ncbi:MAG: RNA methyltransferase [Endozoicomonadaceae bacterium]|nr:RNA methyltransferase [Endozoicomonadaceae bacterium]
MVFENIRIVLVNTKHAGNIGSAARAMKTMGLSSLCLVDPAAEFPAEQATVLASGAADILEMAEVTKTLKQAVEDCVFVVGVSARIRGVSLPVYTPADSAEQILKEATVNKVALIFGREDRGLTNEELRLCHQQVFIPAVDTFNSLNLAASVQILAYELRKIALQKDKRQLVPVKDKQQPMATSGQMEYFYEHLHNMLDSAGFFIHSNQEKLWLKSEKFMGKPDLTRMK